MPSVRRAFGLPPAPTASPFRRARAVPRTAGRRAGLGLGLPAAAVLTVRSGGRSPRVAGPLPAPRHGQLVAGDWAPAAAQLQETPRPREPPSLRWRGGVGLRPRPYGGWSA